MVTALGAAGAGARARSERALRAEGLYKAFGPKPVLQGVDLSVNWGERVALLGPNGSGKTTLLRILAGLARPTGGRAYVAGVDLVAEPEKARPLLGVLSHQSYLYRDLTVGENLSFYAHMYRVPDAEERIVYLLRRVGLEPNYDTVVRTLSRGMLQRLSLARALLHRPAVVLLDEPDTGLDLQNAGVLRDLLRELVDEGCGVLLTTHQLERAALFADRVAVLARGRIVFEGEPGSLDAEDVTEIYRRYAAV